MGEGIEEVLFDLAEALRMPVLLLALVALAIVVFESGVLGSELWRRRHRSQLFLDNSIERARAALQAGDGAAARAELSWLGRSSEMALVIETVFSEAGRPGAEDRINKRLAEFDYRCMRRLERTRILVRFGPALGLMGTLIPLSPALAGLAGGDIQTLTDNLRVAFSITVLGLLVGSLAFVISLIRDRLYGQDYSDLEYTAAQLQLPTVVAAPGPAPTAAQPVPQPAAGTVAG